MRRNELLLGELLPARIKRLGRERNRNVVTAREKVFEAEGVAVVTVGRV